MPFAMPVGVLLILKHFRTVVLVERARIYRFAVYRVTVFDGGERAIQSRRAFGFNCKNGYGVLIP
jgi:hypothetical protein